MHPLATRTAACVARARMPLRPFLRAMVGIAMATTTVPAFAFEAAIEVTPAGELFPALELSQASADAGSGLLRVHLSAASSVERVRVTIDTPGLIAPTVLEAEVDGKRVLRPRLEWDLQALRGLAGVRTQVLEATIERDGKPALVRRLEVRVHPLDEALYFVRDGDARIDLGFMFAAWVDPQSPVIDDLLALAHVADPGFPVRATDAGQRLRQARAVWMALERHDLRYADEGAGISQGPAIYSQRVRLLADTWEERVANCLDGSVLIASALERLGIRSMLVLVPGHAFVGFYTDDDVHHAEFLETTLLGRRLPARSDDPAARAAAGFEAALAAGRTRYRRAASRLDGRHRPNYAVIDIAVARSYGIMPLAVGRPEEGRVGDPAALPASSSSPPRARLP